VSAKRRNKLPSVKASYSLTGNFDNFLTCQLQHFFCHSKICHYHVFVLNFAADMRDILTNLRKHLFNSLKFTNYFKLELLWHILDAVTSSFEIKTQLRVFPRPLHKIMKEFAIPHWQILIYWVPFPLSLERRLKTPLKITQDATIFRINTATTGWNPPELLFSTFVEHNCAFHLILQGNIII